METRWIEISFDVRANRAERVETLCAAELHVALLNITRGDVVEASVAEKIGGGVVGIAQMGTAAADNERELAFVLHLLRIFRENDRFFRADDGGGRLEKNEWLFGDFVAEFGGVRSVIAANTNNFGRRDGSKEANVSEARRVRASRPLPPGLAGDFDNIFTFDDAVARRRR